jgi:hypothetical protein
MAICEQCGNDYGKAFVVTMNGKSDAVDRVRTQLVSTSG